MDINIWFLLKPPFYALELVMKSHNLDLVR